jgi:hypothetical protein
MGFFCKMFGHKLVREDRVLVTSIGCTIRSFGTQTSCRRCDLRETSYPELPVCNKCGSTRWRVETRWKTGVAEVWAFSCNECGWASGELDSWAEVKEALNKQRPKEGTHGE